MSSITDLCSLGLSLQMKRFRSYRSPNGHWLPFPCRALGSQEMPGAHLLRGCEWTPPKEGPLQRPAPCSLMTHLQCGHSPGRRKRQRRGGDYMKEPEGPVMSFSWMRPRKTRTSKDKNDRFAVDCILLYQTPFLQSTAPFWLSVWIGTDSSLLNTSVHMLHGDQWLQVHSLPGRVLSVDRWWLVYSPCRALCI